MPYATQFLMMNPWILAILFAWTLPWKGWALWRAARKEHKIWFVALLLVQTLGILDILYIFVFNRKINNESRL